MARLPAGQRVRSFAEVNTGFDEEARPRARRSAACGATWREGGTSHEWSHLDHRWADRGGAGGHDGLLGREKGRDRDPAPLLPGGALTDGRMQALRRGGGREPQPLGVVRAPRREQDGRQDRFAKGNGREAHGPRIPPLRPPSRLHDMREERRVRAREATPTSSVSASPDSWGTATATPCARATPSS